MPKRRRPWGDRKRRWRCWTWRELLVSSYSMLLASLLIVLLGRIFLIPLPHGFRRCVFYVFPMAALEATAGVVNFVKSYRFLLRKDRQGNHWAAHNFWLAFAPILVLIGVDAALIFLTCTGY